MRTQLPARGSLILAVLVALSTAAAAAVDGPDGLGPRDREELLGYARNTWTSVAAMADRGELPVDGLRRLGDGTWKSSLMTTPTDIASYMWSVHAAERLKIIDADEAHRRLERTLRALERLERVHGFFYDKIDPHAGEVLTKYPDSGKPISPIVSSVDNGWMATALIVVRNSYPPLRGRADALLNPMDFAFFYVPYDAADPKDHPGQIREPYRVAGGTFGGFDRIVNTEQRIVTYIGIARGQLPPEHYYRVERTLRPGEGKQSRSPEGELRTYRGIPVFEGHYTYRGMRLVPSWGGSMFEALMVPLFLPEESWAPRSWGVNHPLYVRAQIAHGLEEAGYGFWGFSPACDPSGGYRTYGVDAIGTDPLGYTSNDDEVRTRPVGPRPRGPFRNGIVTPHASFLALRYAPREAMDNLRKLRDRFPIYGDHGFMDSVNVTSGAVADRVLMLDQGMIMAAIANALADDALRHAFIDGQAERILRPLIAPEEFTAGRDPAPADADGDASRPAGGEPHGPGSKPPR